MYNFGMTYPLKFRQHVLAIKEKEKLTYAETATRFCVGTASLMRWARRIEPCQTRDKPATKKYRLAYIEKDVCVLRYDNEAGKGDHKHIGSQESPIIFNDAAHFRAEVEKYRKGVIS